LHLAVRNNRFEAIKKLVDWIREMNKEYLLNMKDEQGKRNSKMIIENNRVMKKGLYIQ
jgi:vacuolar-type H+-ATPase subunit E/Vma4